MDSDSNITAKARAVSTYDTPAKARGAFLDAYFGDGGYDRDRSARNAGISDSDVQAYFSDPKFIVEIERRLQSMVARKSGLQESMLEQAGYMMEGNIIDLFDQGENGALVVKNIRTLPRHITACIKQMDIVRTVIPGRRAEFTEALRVVMHDKSKVMNIIGDYTDVRNTALKTTDSSAPKMVGLSLTMALPKGDKNEISVDREVPNEQEAERDPTGNGVI